MRNRRERVQRTSKSNAESAAAQCTLFGEPPLLVGEDAAAYDQLLARVYATVKPIDIIEEILTRDFVSLVWDVLRLQRLKSQLIQSEGIKRLKWFLNAQLHKHYHVYAEDYVSCLAQIIEVNCEGYKAKEARALARQSAANEPDADEKVGELLGGIDRTIDDVLKEARAAKTKSLVQGCMRRVPEAPAVVRELLTDEIAGVDALVADGLCEVLDSVERIDRLASIAGSRRDATLQEIERRRAVLGEKLRSAVKEIGGEEMKLIETAPAT